MLFARIVFLIAALFGLGSLIPLYQADGTQAYYGLIAPVAAWQVLFLMIAWQPRRLRPAMIPAFLEKLFWVITYVVFYLRGQIAGVDLLASTALHGVLGVLFALAYYRTPDEAAPALVAGAPGTE